MVSLKHLSEQQKKDMEIYRSQYIDFILNNIRYRKKEGEGGGVETGPLTLSEIEDDVIWMYSKLKAESPKLILLAHSYQEERLFTNFIMNGGLKSIIKNPTKGFENNIFMQGTENMLNSTAAVDLDPSVITDIMQILCREVDRRINGDVRFPLVQSLDNLYSKIVGQNDWTRSKIEKLANIVLEQTGKEPFKSIDENIIKYAMNDSQKTHNSDHDNPVFMGMGPDMSLSFIDYLTKIGELDPTKLEYNRSYEFAKKGIWSALLFREWCVITLLPKRVHRNNQNRLHSLDGSAIEWWANEDRSYFIAGIPFEQKMYDDVVNDRLDPMELITSNINMELRNAILSVMSPEKMIQKFNGQVIDTYRPQKKGQEYMLKDEFERLKHGEINLIMIPKNEKLGNNEDIYYVQYLDPSTQRPYFSMVNPIVGKNHDAALAMATKFEISKEEYLMMKAET
jgi:hypothetical protein